MAAIVLGRRETERGAEAVSLVLMGGEVSAGIHVPIRAMTEAQLLCLERA